MQPSTESTAKENSQLGISEDHNSQSGEEKPSYQRLGNTPFEYIQDYNSGKIMVTFCKQQLTYTRFKTTEEALDWLEREKWNVITGMITMLSIRVYADAQQKGEEDIQIKIQQQLEDQRRANGAKKAVNKLKTNKN